MFKDKVVLITGGSGSWGNELTKQLLAQGVKQIKIYSRGEIAQVAMQRKFNDPRIKFIIGDVRDAEALNWACVNTHFIFHLAALKHVPICEDYPYEAIQTNIQGTKNVIDAAIRNNVKKVIDVSTDKAVNPLNLYGMTKAVGEKLILHANKISKNTDFTVVRGGNALGSNGSVVPFFINQIKKYNKVSITDKNMTRYFLTLPEAVGLLLTAATSHIPGGIFVMKMPACEIIDIAKILIKKYGDAFTKIEEIGIRPGEKIHEVLISSSESCNSFVYNGAYYLIHGNLNEQLPRVNFNEYSSNFQLMGEEAITTLLNNYLEDIK